MKSLVPYLTFNGDCEQALNFYKEVFEGEIVYIKRFKDSPIEASSGDLEKVFDSEITFGAHTVKASDTVPPFEYNSGNNISLFIGLQLEEKVVKAKVDKLSQGGTMLFPFANGFAMFLDKYNIQWMIHNVA
ncbi:MAG: VOC family protein [Bacteroidota bacterium]